MTCIGIILPVRNRWHAYTNKILAQLNQQGLLSDDSNDYVVVVDDGSTDGTTEKVKSLYPAAHLLLGNGNLWWGGAINEGMKYLLDFPNVEAIVWLNDDLIIPNDFVEKLKIIAPEAIENNAIIGGLAVSIFDSNWIAFCGVVKSKPLRYINDLKEDLTEVSHLSGNIVILPSAVVKTVGYIDILRFPHYNADYDYTHRARKNGIQLLISRDLKAETQYDIKDVIRYMPVWMQFYLEKNPNQRIKIFSNMRSRKFIYNIRTLVDSINADQKSEWWNYEAFYIKKILQCIFYTFLPKKQINKIFLKYFESEQIHPKIASEILEIL